MFKRGRRETDASSPPVEAQPVVAVAVRDDLTAGSSSGIILQEVSFTPHIHRTKT
jgi:hypothetical protein